MPNVQVIDTGDGSHSLLDTDLQETYHSRHGAIRESTHVFIDNGLRVVDALHSDKHVRILEIGFGTGLNALLTLQAATRLHLCVTYQSWEKNPLPPAVVEQLNFGTMLADAAAFRALHLAEWNLPVTAAPGFELMKVHRDILADQPGGAFELVYYDAFAPSKQPEMWTREILGKVTKVLSPGGIWVSYCARGQVKRDLAALGLKVETLPGPPGKKEMTRATFSP